jgi:hypothetical protein
VAGEGKVATSDDASPKRIALRHIRSPEATFISNSIDFLERVERCAQLLTVSRARGAMATSVHCDAKGKFEEVGKLHP